MRAIQAGDIVYRFLGAERMTVQHVYATDAGSIAWCTFTKKGVKNTTYYMTFQLFLAKR